jgi:magnesium-protoporphyrin O-methyltransferase
VGRDRRPDAPICCAQDFERLFDSVEAQHDLDEYHASGPAAATRHLIHLLTSEGVDGATLIDVGAGIGAVHLELLGAGAASAVDVDASRAFLQLARQEAERQGSGAQVEHLYGDFVRLAPGLAKADVVTLDRVICCYPHIAALLTAVADRAQRLIGIVHPVDAWWSRAGAATFNAIGDTFRRRHHFYVHRHRTVDAVLGAGGFRVAVRDRVGFWEVSVYRAVG